MKQFRRITIQEMEASKRAQEMKRALEEFAEGIADTINKNVEEVVRELGYQYSDNMTPEEVQQLGQQMQADGVDIVVDDEMDGNVYRVAIKVVQTARVLEFNLGGER